ncbi:hypothetical protein [Staphylococcus massiliensis]|uniref:hypothetical protein n=1 Tax=Staphylococcus massiliensis TaxID=555791 RepID=UPI001EE0BA0D|nr:hypothetical protein [Staphylococcus massiliensis]
MKIKKTTSEEKKKKDQKETKDKKKKETQDENEAKTQEAKSTEVNENINNQTTNTNNQNTSIQVNVNNITDRNTLVSVLNSGNYSEIEKIHAYNSAVANGVIPQGNVMEGPAIKAYESSLRVENGEEKSIYDMHEENNSENHRTPEEQAAHEAWVNGQIEWSNATSEEREQIRQDRMEENEAEYDEESY